jgi:large subunit ribosomal protein L25
MSEEIQLAVTSRAGAGKGAARAARRENLIPAVIYGGNQAPEIINIERKLIDKFIHYKGFMTHIMMLENAGKSHKVLVRDIQFHPVKDNVIHIDFLRVTDETEVVVHVPVRFKNMETCVGLKRGGVLNIVRHSVDLKCKAKAIPDEIFADIANYNVGDSIHISAFEMDAGVKPTITNRDFTVATIVAPSSLKSEESSSEATPAATEAEAKK